MDELIDLLRGMRTDADQAIQLLTSGQYESDFTDPEETAAILAQIRAWRDEIDALIEQFGDPRDERA